MQSIPLPNETQLAEEYNRLSSFELCITSQELIQELILKSSELVNTFRSITLNLIYSDQNTYLARKAKTEDLLKNFDLIFLRLRIISKLLHQRKQNKLIEESSHNNETHDKLEAYKFEKDRLIGQIKDKNKYIKEAIDRVSNIIWQINSIQTLKH
ncbi:unnamed protein product [Brachionus calyciflorus]|uniref:Mediator of RNA polymerase II transcription subunit 30 n=1 Tax=Brachionus calyciflorus TaxID=104777 RepID=A0A813ZH61_9BILA|nr:unnamed protein product [Brachionus calyciflorus]